MAQQIIAKTSQFSPFKKAAPPTSIVVTSAAEDSAQVAAGGLRLSPGASPTTSTNDGLLSPNGSMSESSGSNVSSQIIELPPLGADPDTVSRHEDVMLAS